MEPSPPKLCIRCKRPVGRRRRLYCSSKCMLAEIRQHYANPPAPPKLCIRCRTQLQGRQRLYCGKQCVWLDYYRRRRARRPPAFYTAADAPPAHTYSLICGLDPHAEFTLAGL